MRISSLTMSQHSVNNMSKSQERISNTMEHISSGKKYLLPSDNPLESNRIQLLKDNAAILDTYKTNNTLAENYLSSIETNLNNLHSTLQRINELEKQGSSALLSDDQRVMLATEIESRLQELVSIANRADSQGHYLFSGYRNTIQPYALNNGNYEYQGDSGERILQVGVNVYVPITLSGHELFEKVKTGNGTFVTTDGSVTNTGNGIISTGHVLNASSYNPQEVYTIDFVTNSSGKLGYAVTGSMSGQIIPAFPNTIPSDAPTYISGNSIQFNGIEVSISGEPAVGDDFKIVSSQPQNMFNSIQNIANAMKLPVTTDAEGAAFFNELDRQSASMNQAYHNVLNQLTRVGAMSNVVQSERLINDDLHLHNERTLSLLEDVDMAEAASKLSQDMSALEVAQKSYAKIQSQSLFNYL